MFIPKSRSRTCWRAALPTGQLGQAELVAVSSKLDVNARAAARSGVVCDRGGDEIARCIKGGDANQRPGYRGTACPDVGQSLAWSRARHAPSPPMSPMK